MDRVMNRQKIPGKDHFSEGDGWPDAEQTGNAVLRLAEALRSCDAVLIGAGSGLSTSAGFTYRGERFRRYFLDFERKYGFHDMYSGGFYHFAAPEEQWAYWSRYIFVNRFMDPPLPVYSVLYELMRGREYFVLTTNVDHCFQKAGFDKKRLFYTQGDYGLFQCSKPCCRKTWEHGAVVREMLESQGIAIGEGGTLALPEDGSLRMRIDPDLVPHCPNCGRPMTMNLRADDTFVEDAGWYRAAGRYSRFLRQHAGARVLYLELGVGYNTPGIIKYPFWRMTKENPDAVLACLNQGEAIVPEEIRSRSICMDGDIGTILARLPGSGGSGFPDRLPPKAAVQSA